MNVTAANAIGVLGEWRDLLDRCEFYTVDQEMTGITGKKPIDREAHLSEHYDNVKHAVEKYEAFQYGICLFERRSNSNSDGVRGGGDGAETMMLGSASEYIVRPFSFWLFRSDSDVSFEGRAVKFLLKNHMNFQFWMENGFAYGNSDVNACPNHDDFTEEEKKWIAEKFAAINDWYDNGPAMAATLALGLDTDSSSRTPLTSLSLTAVVDPMSPTTPALPLASASSSSPIVKDEYCLDTFVSYRADVYLHYLLYAQTKHIPEGHEVPADIKENKGRRSVFNALPSKSLLGGFREPSYCRVWFTRLSPSSSTEAAGGANTFSSAIERGGGEGEEPKINTISIPAKPTFYPFFKALIESKKPHIGHNYFTDLMFQINQHYDGTKAKPALPEAYSGFKKLVGELFPTIYDTKVLLAMLATPLKNSSLGFAYEEIKNRSRKQRGVAKKFRFPLGFNDYSKVEGSGSAVAHDGAYDAFMTGVVFLYILSTSSPSNNAVNEFTTTSDGRALKRTLCEVIENENNKNAQLLRLARKKEQAIDGHPDAGGESEENENGGGDEKVSVVAFEGIPEGYATYEGVIAQFGSKYWMALRRPHDDVPADVNGARTLIMSLVTPAVPTSGGN